MSYNREVIKIADWILDLGSEGGDAGGKIVFEGTPEDLIKCEQYHTGRMLKQCLE
jgi:excinuclease ABC subunit A